MVFFAIQQYKFKDKANMSKKEMTLVYYHVPQDRDDPECPNVFGVPFGKTNLRLVHIYEAFPLKGTYLFRFKYNCEGQTVWLDLPDLEAKLPTFKDKIIVKATRVSWLDSKLHSNYKEKQTFKTSDGRPATVNQIDFFQQSPAPKTEVKTSKQSSFTQNHMDILGQKSFSQPIQQSSPVTKITPTSPASNVGLDFLGQSTTQKKQQINLLGSMGHDFSKHGDLI